MQWFIPVEVRVEARSTDVPVHFHNLVLCSLRKNSICCWLCPWKETSTLTDLPAVVQSTLTLLNTRQQAQTGVTYAKPHANKPRLDLITVLTFFQNGTLQQSIGNYLVSTSEVIYLTGSLHPLQEGDLVTTNLLFAWYDFPVLTPFHLVQLLRFPFYLLDERLPNVWIIK